MKTLGAVLVFAFACGPSGNRGGLDGNGNGDGSGSGNGSDGCSDSAKLVYVVDVSNRLSTFYPPTKTFHDLGTLNCPAMFLATPFSMGIDRTPTAWVLYSSGELFKVDPASLACTKTSWNRQLGLMQFGMGFSTDSAGGTADTLFVAGGAGPMQPTSTLAKLDTNSMMASSLGTVQGWPELTGTGNAELWGFFPDANNPRVEKLNKASGAALTTYPEASIRGMPMDWAFAFWGGDFWIFLQRSGEVNTVVYQVDGMNGMMKSMTQASGRSIVGAGVSTCAPVVIQ
jgi:hypothetical protein